MRNVKLSGFLSLIVLGLISVGLFGCGVPSANFGTYLDYLYPSWTSDGKIICVKKVSDWEETGGFRRITSEKYYITTMSEEGTQEANIKQIDNIGKVSASPKGNYIAYTDGNYIRITGASGNIINSINGENEISSVSWSPDETNIAFSIYKSGPSWEMYVVRRDDAGGGSRLLSLGDSGGWSSDGRYLAYDMYLYSSNTPVDGGLYLYELSSGQITKLITMEGASPEFIMPANELLIYVDGGSIKTINVTTREKAVLINNQYLSGPKCGPDGLKILFGEGSDSGVWISNIDGTDLKQIK